MIFEKYRLQGAVWSALGEGDGVAILHNFLIFGISDNIFFVVTKSHCHLDLDPVLMCQVSTEVLHVLVYHSLITDECLVFFVSK